MSVVADDFGDHTPVWFPGMVADTEALMPVSPSLLEELRAWNRIFPEASEAGIDASTEHSRVGLDLARRLAQELGPGYAVRFLAFGKNGNGWTWAHASVQ